MEHMYQGQWSFVKDGLLDISVNIGLGQISQGSMLLGQMSRNVKSEWVTVRGELDKVRYPNRAKQTNRQIQYMYTLVELGQAEIWG